MKSNTRTAMIHFTFSEKSGFKQKPLLRYFRLSFPTKYHICSIIIIQLKRVKTIEIMQFPVK